MCDEAVRIEPRSLAWVTDQYKVQVMCKEAVRRDPCTLGNVADHFMMQEMCKEAMCENPAAFFLYRTILREKRCVLIPLK